MKIAVIGAHGFIGRAVMARLPEAVAVGRGDAIPRADFVIHLARVGRAEAVEHLERTAADRFVFVSTAKVNGETTAEGQVFSPDDTPAPQSAYAREKLATELALREIAGDRLTIVRPPLVYGPGARGNFAALVSCVNRGLPLPIANADNRRALVGVDNLADFLARCCAEDRGGIYLPADTEISTAELAREIGVAARRPARLFAAPKWLVPMPIRRRLFDSFRIEPGADWPLSLKEGLHRAIPSPRTGSPRSPTA